MKNSENKVKLIGYLETTPNITEFKSGKKIARFSIVTSEAVKQNDKLLKATKWHSIVAWDKNACIAQENLSKGSEVIISGRLINKEYKDSGNNIKVLSEILAESILFRNLKNIIAESKTGKTTKRA